jgi:membrane protein DedA with SNARE-associated domain
MDDLLISHGSYLAIIVVLIMTGAGLPLPEEIPIIAAGVLAGRGQLDPWLGLASCIFGAMAGDCAMYWIGRRFGRGLLVNRHWFARFVTPEREAQVEQLFRRHGLKVFFTARFLVLLRSPLLLAAGIMRLPFARFFFIDLISAIVVVGSFYGLAYFFGRAVYDWIRTSEWALTFVVLITAVVVALVLWRRRRRPVPQALGNAAAPSGIQARANPQQSLPRGQISQDPSAPGRLLEAGCDVHLVQQDCSDCPGQSSAAGKQQGQSHRPASTVPGAPEN